ncbi:YihY/virulence factor BrkB family protein [Luteibacter sahnii]|uniref:YihY/virulence factor BrkB family protein n=1 Tax=Luteibacter sahnii TaxID=3021977 RepID=UPI002A6B8540|nr:YihY/virulence factor BrkB family protein [Luteibacter sp. PPL193]MDY1549543.1 YihY/virulence factor BrkB family protein [Luteibacter sp. PPL193]
MPDIFKTRAGRVVRSAIDGFSDDELMTRAAALAFYAALSVAPLLLLMVWTIAMLHPAWQSQLVEAMTSVVGPKAAGVLVTVIQSAEEHPRLGNIAGIVGLGVTLFSASAVFAQLQGTLDRVWRVKPKPGKAVGAWLRARARAFALLIGVAFLLIVSLVVSAVIESVLGRDGAAWSTLKYAVSILVFAGVFGMMFRVLPDARIDWSDAIFGACLTTVLFLLGEFVIGLYVAHSDVGGAYGPAGAFVVLLIWTYYSSLIVLMGAELTRGVAEARGKGIRPSPHAVQIEAAPAEVKRDTPVVKPRPRRAHANAPGWLAVGVVAGVALARYRRRG